MVGNLKARTHSNAGIKMVEAKLLVSLLVTEMRVGGLYRVRSCRRVCLKA